MRLLLCEKPSQGRDIGRVLGATRDGGGCLLGDGVTVTWCIGHLLEMAPPESYDAAFKTWDLGTLPILPDRWLLEVKDKARGQFKRVQELLAQAREVVIATDADREGEVIAREILERCRWRGPTRRLWLSALDPASIRKALAQIQDGERTEPLYQAGLGRGRADWLVGMNLTRAYTVLGRQGGHEGVLSVGRVQTPTLALVVARDREIEGFRSAAYYDLLAQIAVRGGRFRARWRPAGAGMDERGRCLDRARAQAALARVTGAAGRIILAQQARKAEPAPLPFSLSALQQEASRRWGMPVKAVLAAAQALYETHKATTYPRSDCACLPVSQHAEAPAVLAALARSDARIAATVANADAALKSAAWNDAKVTAHHAIIPTAAVVDPARMSADERRIYELVRGRYLAQFYPDYEYLQTDVEAEVGGEVFVARARQPVVTGWRAVPDLIRAEGEGKDGGEGGSGEDEANQVLPPMRVGEDCRCLDASIREGQTEPPRRYTEGTLVAAMKSVGKSVQDPALRKVLRETSGIGTEATRAGILDTLFQRGYIERKGKKEIISTATGRALIDQVAPELRDPVITAVWEQGLDEIASGKRELHAFLAQQADWVRQQVERVQRGEAAWTAPAGSAGADPCPACGQPLRRRKGSHGAFWGCSGYPDCRQTVPDVRGKPGQGVGVKSPKGPVGAGNGGPVSEPASTARASPARCACGGEIRESAKAWQCQSCRAIVWRQMAGKTLTERQAQRLLGGAAVELAGLRSRVGKTFSATARIEDGKVKLVFGGG